MLFTECFPECSSSWNWRMAGYISQLNSGTFQCYTINWLVRCFTSVKCVLSNMCRDRLLAFHYCRQIFSGTQTHQLHFLCDSGSKLWKSSAIWVIGADFICTIQIISSHDTRAAGCVFSFSTNLAMPFDFTICICWC